MPPTPQPVDDSHQLLLDQMDISHLTKPFRNPNWKPSQRRNKNIKQILSEVSKREASVLATQNNSGASTPGLVSRTETATATATGTGTGTTDGTLTPTNKTANSVTQAAQNLGQMVLERNLQKAVNDMKSSVSTSSGAPGGAGNQSGSSTLNVPGQQGPVNILSSLGPAVTYTNIESAPSLHPAHQKHYCDITGLPARYTDPKTRLRYYDREIFAVVRSLPQGGPDQYLAARGANVVLK